MSSEDFDALSEQDKIGFEGSLIFEPTTHYTMMTWMGYKYCGYEWNFSENLENGISGGQGTLWIYLK
jgi:hypothetical protein